MERIQTDVLVAGGSLEGCVAAAELAGRGKKVLLAEESGSLGGLSANGLEIFLPVRETEGKAREYAEYFLEEAGEEAGAPFYQDQKMKLALRRMLEKRGVTVLTHMFPAGAELQGDEAVCRLAGKTGILEIGAKVLIDGTAYLELTGAAGLPMVEKRRRMTCAVKWEGIAYEPLKNRMAKAEAEGPGYLAGKIAFPFRREWKGIHLSAENLRFFYREKYGETILTGLAAELPDLSEFSRSDAMAGLRFFAYELRDELRKKEGMEKASVIHAASQGNLYGLRRIQGQPWPRLIVLNEETDQYENWEAIGRGIAGARKAEEVL